ncbi:MAG: hypothetical protein KA777_05855, partial [Rhodoferax sp.]|nr:hypothetical protein [Rhodoferax sp.]
SQAAAATYLNNPGAALGQLDLYPRVGQLQAPALNTSGLSAYADWNRDFNGAAETWTTRGAYAATGANPGWLPQLGIKP